MNLNYLIFDLIIISGPLIASILPIAIKPRFLSTSLSLFLTTLLFFFLDVFATNFLWFFNEKYILNIKVLNVPVEEIMFFIFTGYACLFLYINLKSRLIIDKKISFLNYSFISLFLLIAVIMLLIGKYYTFLMITIFIGLIILDIFLIKTKIFEKSFFWFFLFIIFLLTLIFNYYLTNKPIVTYNDKFNLNLKILSIPIEDFIYGFSFVSLIVLLYEFFDKIFDKFSNKS